MPNHVGYKSIWPSDGDTYNEKRKNNNADFDYHPRVIVTCQTEQDVIHAMRYAKDNNIAIRIRSGGHNYEALSLADDALIIDLSEMNEIQMADGLVRIQPGARLGIVYDVLGDQGMTIPGGTCPFVRVGGLTQGGGVGMMHRAMGLTCDSLVAARMVTADLNVITATETNEHKELLWALKGGGGGNFGVVTEMTFRTHIVNEPVCIFSIVWPFEDAEAVLKAWIDWAPETDERLTSMIRVYAPPKSVTTTAENKDLPSPSEVTVLGMFLGPEQDFKKAIDEFLKMTPSDEKDQAYQCNLDIKVAIEHLSGAIYKEELTNQASTNNHDRWVVHFSGNLKKPGSGIDEEQEWYKISSAFAGEVFQKQKDEVVKLILSELDKSTSDKNFLSMHALGGRVEKVDPTSTAFYHRNSKFVLQFQAFWDEKSVELAEPSKQWIQEFRTTLLPYTTGAFINFVDLSIKNWPTAYYNANFTKLVEVKTKYDPSNLFNFQMSIPPLQTTSDVRL